MDKERDNTGVFTAEQQLNARLNVGKKKRRLMYQMIKTIVPEGASVVDIGAGPGKLVKTCMHKTNAYKIFGLDGSEGIEEISEGRTFQFDVTEGSGKWDKCADWGLMLNVGEHVPRKLEWELAKGTARIPRKWLVVAWADEKTPDWRAKNRREASYVANLFGRLGWCLSEEKTRQARAVAGQFSRMNKRLLVFRRSEGLTMKFVRVLYGGDFERTRPKILKDLRKSFRRNPEFAQETVVYYTMGREATQLLEDKGARNIVEVHPEPIMRVSGGVLSWNKLYLVREALKEYGEVLYTDMDTYPALGFDQGRVMELLYAKKGLGRLMQMPLISYKKGYFWFRPREGNGWTRVTPLVGLFGCFMYFTCVELLDWFFEDYEELIEKYPKKKAGDEQFITYSVDKRFGRMTLQELWDSFQPDQRLIRPRCGMLKGLVDKGPEPIFRHRR